MTPRPVVAPQLHPNHDLGISLHQHAVTGDRARAIAAIHSLAGWFLLHPEVPMPTTLMAGYSVTPRDEADEQTRVAGVLALADQLAMAPYEGERVVQAHLELADKYDGDPLTITYRVSAHKDDGSRRRYVDGWRK